jgi:hypothetical protein
VRMLPTGLTRPGWLWQWSQDRASAGPAGAQPGGTGRSRATLLRRLRRVDGHAATHLGSIAWLRELWGGPFMLKGVMRVDDAKRAVDVGVSAISVSNHGGDNPDGTPAANGQAGVENVRDVLRGGIDSALIALAALRSTIWLLATFWCRPDSPGRSACRPTRTAEPPVPKPQTPCDRGGRRDWRGWSAARFRKFSEINCCACANNWRTPGEIRPTIGGCPSPAS